VPRSRVPAVLFQKHKNWPEESTDEDDLEMEWLDKNRDCRYNGHRLQSVTLRRSFRSAGGVSNSGLFFVFPSS
jgi:hypothetical protein